MKKLNLILLSLMVMTIGLTSCEEPETLSTNENMELIGTWERVHYNFGHFEKLILYIDYNGLDVSYETPLKWTVTDNKLTIYCFGNGSDQPLTYEHVYDILSVDNKELILLTDLNTKHVYRKLK